MRYFDAHVHLLPPRRLRGLIRWVKRIFPGYPLEENVTVDEVVAEMRGCGADYIVNLMFPLWEGEIAALHEFSAELAARVPRLLPFAGVHPADADCVAQTVRAFDELGLVGLKIHTMVQHVDPLDERLRPVFAEVERRRLPLWLHTGFEFVYDFEFPDEHLRRVARRHPDMPIVLAHSVFPRLQFAFELAEACPNVYLDMTNVFGVMAHPDLYMPPELRTQLPELTEVLRWGLQAYAGRVVFGTDHPAGLGGVEQILADMAQFDVPAPARRAMLRDAPRALFERWAPERMRAV